MIRNVARHLGKYKFVKKIYDSTQIPKFMGKIWHNYCKSLKPEEYLAGIKRWYFNTTKQELDFDNLQTFNEKMQWIKLYDSTPLKTQLADKYLVRGYVAEKIGEEYLIPLLGVWDSFDEIDFEKLPDQFVLKTNHASGTNIIVTDKSKFDIKDAQKKFQKWLSEPYGIDGFELHYFNIPRKIIAEKYIENIDGNIVDYKIQCFNGEPKYIQLVWGRTQNNTYECTYDLGWNKMPFRLANTISDKNIEKPACFDELIQIAKTLSAEFYYVRVDMYVTNEGHILFGEMTFTSLGGIYPYDVSEIFGKHLNLPIND